MRNSGAGRRFGGPCGLLRRFRRRRRPGAERRMRPFAAGDRRPPVERRRGRRRSSARRARAHQRLCALAWLRESQVPDLRLESSATVRRGQRPDLAHAGQSRRSAGARRRRSRRSRRPLQFRVRARRPRGAEQRLRGPVRRDREARQRRPGAAAPVGRRLRGSERSAGKRPARPRRQRGRPRPRGLLRGVRAHLRRQLLSGVLFGRRKPGGQPRGRLPGLLPERRRGPLFVPVRGHDRGGRVALRRALCESGQRAASSRKPSIRTAPAGARGRAGRRRSPMRKRATATRSAIFW